VAVAFTAIAIPLTGFLKARSRRFAAQPLAPARRAG
jgi:hypothetical protein